jgi:formate-dependent nitrite reductase membrane component NrfD
MIRSAPLRMLAAVLVAVLALIGGFALRAVVIFAAQV